jgi:hypothetical protein
MAKAFFRTGLLFSCAALAALAPWLAVRVQQAANSDILWLCEALHRYLGGLRLSEAAYETNPPLSLLVYILPVLGRDALHLPLHYTVFAQSLLLALLAAGASLRILKARGAPGAGTIYLAAFCFLLANTVGASLYFGERDHLIGIALMPFFLMQLGLTYGWPQPRRLKWPVFLAGSLFILLKPHHGLLPACLLAHRIWRRRDLSAVKDADFISLAAATLAYGAGVFLFFPDYVATILPDALRLYVAGGSWRNVAFPLAAAAGGGAVLAAAAAALPKGEIRWLACRLLAAGMLSLIPYAAQGMGFYYQILPALSFLFTAAGLILCGWLEKEGVKHAAFSAGLFMTALAYLFAPLNIHYARHKDYANLPLTRLLEAECPARGQCRFFMFNRDMGIVQETAYYTGIPHISRFPSLWFLPEILKARAAPARGGKAPFGKEEADAYAKKYAAMMAEDFRRGKPDVVILWRPGPLLMNFDFVRFFSADPAFAREWRHYRREKTISISYGQYFKGTKPETAPMEYDVYKRVE